MSWAERGVSDPLFARPSFLAPSTKIPRKAQIIRKLYHNVVMVGPSPGLKKHEKSPKHPGMVSSLLKDNEK
jgi:hypothetical protein